MIIGGGFKMFYRNFKLTGVWGLSTRAGSADQLKDVAQYCAKIKHMLRPLCFPCDSLLLISFSPDIARVLKADLKEPLFLSIEAAFIHHLHWHGILLPSQGPRPSTVAFESLYCSLRRRPMLLSKWSDKHRYPVLHRWRFLSLLRKHVYMSYQRLMLINEATFLAVSWWLYR